MRGTRSKCDFVQARDENIMEVYRSVRSSKSYFGSKNAYCCITANSPARKHWISSECAYKGLLRLLKGDLMPEVMSIRRELFLELYALMVKERAAGNTQPLRYVCEKIIEAPAKKFYISGGRVRFIVNQHERRRK